MFELHGWAILDQEAVREAEPGAAAERAPDRRFRALAAKERLW
jgi:hypothetical protein